MFVTFPTIFTANHRIYDLWHDANSLPKLVRKKNTSLSKPSEICMPKKGSCRFCTSPRPWSFQVPLPKKVGTVAYWLTLTQWAPVFKGTRNNHLLDQVQKVGTSPQRSSRPSRSATCRFRNSLRWRRWGWAEKQWIKTPGVFCRGILLGMKKSTQFFLGFWRKANLRFPITQPV